MSAKSNIKKISVFIACSSELYAECKQFQIAVKQLNAVFADSVEFEILGYQEALSSTDSRNQSVINQEIDRCDIFFLMVHKNWKQKTAHPTNYSIQEKFYRALNQCQKNGVPQIFAFFKHIKAAQQADAGPQLKDILSFRQELEKNKQVICQYINESKRSFIDDIKFYFRAYIKGELDSINTTRNIVVLPPYLLEEIKNAKQEITVKIKLAEQAKKDSTLTNLKTEFLQLANS